MTTQSIGRNANNNYQQFTGTEAYHRYLCGYVLTDGAYEVGKDYGCYWFLDIICSYVNHPKASKEYFQVWKLERKEGDSFQVTMEDGNDHTIIKQRVPWSDFKDDQLTLWCVDHVIMLPSEY